MGARRLERLRQHAISKVWAVWFIVLILLPVTAPFPTYRLHHSSNGFPNDAIPKDLKDKVGSDDDLAVPSSWSSVPEMWNVVTGGFLPSLKQTRRRSLQYTVLRL
jgi:hypothetical protein